MRKRIITSLLLFSLCLSAACGTKENEVADKTQQVENTPVETPVVESKKKDVPDYSVTDIEKMNEGKNIDIEYGKDGSQVNLIDGKYSEIVIENAEDALDAIQGVRSIIGLKDAYSELTLFADNSDEYGPTYTFSQLYNGYKVYGRSITVSADKTGIVDWLNSGVLATSKLDKIDISTSTSKDEAEKTATEYFGGKCVADEKKTELIFYTLGEYENNPVLAYAISVNGKDKNGEYVASTVFVDIKDGTIVSINSEIMH